MAVAIPSYNEDRFIGSVVLKAKEVADIVVVVDDGSRDRTAEVAEAAGATVIRHERNRGKAAGIATSFRWAEEAGVDCLVLIDGDGQHDPADIPQVVEPVLRDEADMVVGTRFSEVQSRIPTYRQFGQHALTTLTNVASGVAISDSQSGFRAFSRAAIKKMRFRSTHFAVESEMQFIAYQAGLRVTEVPIHVVYAEPAKRSPVRHGTQIVHSLLDQLERRRPLYLFGVVGTSLIIIGLILGVKVTATYALNEQLAVGFAILSTALIIVGVFFGLVGIILHALRVMIDDLRQP
ncbi:MAG: glycosyltransferase family 2 protein [Chloroflexi bacterium]|nr:glycosyltransferase family 2 protein [Chloroflexota bacterium]